LEIRGSGFLPSSRGPTFGGQDVTTTFVSDKLLTVAVPASAITVLGDIGVQVVTLTSSCDPHTTFGGKGSNVLTFAVTPAPPGVIGLASVADDGSEALGGDSERSSVSMGGRLVAFDSRADNLVPNDTNSSSDIFLRDTCIGASETCVPSTILVSDGSGGTPANGDSTNPVMNVVTSFTVTSPLDTPSGRFIAFQSSADNLVAGDTNGKVDVFVRDTCVGVTGSCTPSTIRVSVASDGGEGNGDSMNPAISDNGNYLVFQSSATNFTPHDTNGTWDVFVRYTCVIAAEGCVQSTTPVSVAITGGLGDGSSVSPSISEGQLIAFQSAATNLVAKDTNGSDDIFVRDACAYRPPDCTPSTIRITAASDGTQSNNRSTDPSISAEGRFVAFASLADNLVPNDTNNRWDVFVRDTCFPFPTASDCVPLTTRVSVASDGSESEGDASEVEIRPSMAASGRYIAFSSSATNLVAGDMNGNPDIFVRATCLSAFVVSPGCQPSTIRLSVAGDGAQGNGGSVLPSISADGGYITFKSTSTNLVANDTNGLADIYLSLY
jgi:Tol biopolymer transport system component